MSFLAIPEIMDAAEGALADATEDAGAADDQASRGDEGGPANTFPSGVGDAAAGAGLLAILHWVRHDIKYAAVWTGLMVLGVTLIVLGLRGSPAGQSMQIVPVAE